MRSGRRSSATSSTRFEVRVGYKLSRRGASPRQQQLPQLSYRKRCRSQPWPGRPWPCSCCPLRSATFPLSFASCSRVSPPCVGRPTQSLILLKSRKASQNRVHVWHGSAGGISVDCDHTRVSKASPVVGSAGAKRWPEIEASTPSTTRCPPRDRRPVTKPRTRVMLSASH